MSERKKELMWSHIYWLSVLSRTGSYTTAAKRLGVSKGAVSLRITELEQVSGVALVRRTTRSVRLTEAGQSLVASTQQAFTTIEQGFESVQDLSENPRGRIRVTAPVALGRQKIVPLIGRFLQECPDISVEIELSDHLSSLVKEGFDLAVRHASEVPETHVAWLLQTSRTLLVATPEYLEKYGTPKTPEDLASHNCLYYLRSAAYPVWSFTLTTGADDLRSVAVRGNFCANNSEALREVVLANQGIAFLPDFTANNDVESGRLVHILANWKPIGVFGDSIYVIRPYTAHVPRAVSAFINYLKNELKDD